MFIRSERLFLRPAWAEDARDLHTAVADTRIVPNLARLPWPYTLEDACAFVSLPQDRRYPELLVTLPSAGGSRLIGSVGLHEHDDCAELGYWLVPDVWGRGFATEAASAVLRLARTIGHRQVAARHFVDNAASGRVLEKLGFRRMGAVTERYSAGRGGVSASCEYLLRFDCTGNRDDPPPADDSEMGKRAA
jgi:RimJ/RimL family protein N-acetyltransferase